MMFDINIFPPLPNYSASFRAIYFEPIAQSGERFTIGILAKSDSGDTRVLQCISDKTLHCMYGQNDSSVKQFVHLILQSARDHVDQQGEVATWIPPIAGVHLSEVQTSYAVNGIEGILFQALSQFASLYKGQIVENALVDFNGNYVQEDSEVETSNRSLIRQVRDICIERGKSRDLWQKELSVKDRGKITIDYLGAYYNANLSNFNVQHVRQAYGQAKAKLFDLDVLRTKRESETMVCQQKFELLISMNPTPSNEAIDNYYSLEDLADSIELRVERTTTPMAIAERILGMDIAA